MHIILPNIKLEISRNEMKAYITLMEDKKSDNLEEQENHEYIYEKTDIDRIVEEIKDIITVGLDEERVRQILIDRDYNKQMSIADAIIPVDGEDGYIKYCFDQEKELTPKVLKDGTVDYRELDSINNINKNEILVKFIAPKEGKNGLKVNGKSIPYKKGKKANLRYGRNVKLSDDGTCLLAEKSGIVEFKNSKLSVSEVLEVSNIDKKTGNISFSGTVIVRGNILNGYRVKADGDVEVKGLVEGGCIENIGEVLVRRGVQGYNRLSIKTKGNIITKFIENAKIKSDKDITAEAIMHSDVVSEGGIKVIGKRGLIAGGICKARKEIRAKTVGSSMATTTVLEIGMESLTQNKIDKLKENIETIESNLSKVVKSIKLIDKLKKIQELDDEKTEMYIKLTETKDSLTKKLNALKKEEEVINENIKESSKGKIRVSGTVYPGVKIIIGNSVYFVKDEMQGCMFYREEGDIRVGPC